MRILLVWFCLLGGVGVVWGPERPGDEYQMFQCPADRIPRIDACTAPDCLDTPLFTLQSPESAPGAGVNRRV
jgi:hypothetical protein